MPPFSVLLYFVWPEWQSMRGVGGSRQVQWPGETPLYAPEPFPLTRWKNPPVASIIAIVNAWPPQCATCSLSAPEVLLPVHSRFICCLLASMAELEISRARPVPTKSPLIHKYSRRFHCGSGLLSLRTERRTLNLLLITKCYAINAAMTNSQGQSPDGEGRKKRRRMHEPFDVGWNQRSRMNNHRCRSNNRMIDWPKAPHCLR